MVKKLSDYTYEPNPMTRPALKKTPYDQTKITPSTAEPLGKYGGLSKKVSGGAQQGGGKRRPDRVSKG